MRKMATYLFTYIIMYYSIYKFSFEWEYINLNMLKLLWKQHGNMEENAEFIFKRNKTFRYSTPFFKRNV